MTELKTLKDLQEDEEGFLSNNVFADDLKAEAVKWVKELNWTYCRDGRRIFMDFFNLTEEDLR